MPGSTVTVFNCRTVGDPDKCIASRISHFFDVVYKYIYIYILTDTYIGHNGVTVSYEFIDLWTEVREWSVRPV